MRKVIKTINTMNQKQIDNLSKYCYDISKILLGLTVVENLLSDTPSWRGLSIGFVSTSVFLLMGYFLDKKEVTNGDTD